MKRNSLIVELEQLLDETGYSCDFWDDVRVMEIQDLENQLEMFKHRRDVQKKHAYSEELKNFKEGWMEILEEAEIPCIGKLKDHIVQNGRGVVERDTKKMIQKFGYKVVESWWDEYRGPSIEF